MVVLKDQFPINDPCSLWYINIWNINIFNYASTYFISSMTMEDKIGNIDHTSPFHDTLLHPTEFLLGPVFSFHLSD